MTRTGRTRVSKARTLAAVGIGALALLATSAPATTTASAAPAERGGKCIHRHDFGANARVVAGTNPRVDPNTLTQRRWVAMNRSYREAVSRLPAGVRAGNKHIRVPVYVHVVKGKHNRGHISNKRIRAQIRVLNNAYAGRAGRHAHSTPFRFTLKGVDRTKNPTWFRHYPGSKAERKMKQALRVGDESVLNLYTANPRPGALLGYAYYPQNYRKHPSLDGVVVNVRSTPGGHFAGFGQVYAHGDTATHEVGHWLGLAHTFQGGCGTRNDFVTDTAKEQSPASGCPRGSDTCPAEGLDPIHNFMDYSVDPCMNMVTQGQAQRMRLHWLAYRR